MVSTEYLLSVLEYDPENGVLVWLPRPESMFNSHHEFKRWNTRYAGVRAGFINEEGYVSVKLKGKDRAAHRLIFKMLSLECPNEIDHINGERSDNRLSNLRSVTLADNMKNKKIYANNSSGVSGVGWYKKYSKWRARIHVDGKSILLGYYDNIETAIKARIEAEDTYGFHQNHGKR